MATKIDCGACGYHGDYRVSNQRRGGFAIECPKCDTALQRTSNIPLDLTMVDHPDHGLIAVPAEPPVERVTVTDPGVGIEPAAAEPCAVCNHAPAVDGQRCEACLTLD